MIRFTREPRRRQGAWMVGQVEAVSVAAELLGRHAVDEALPDDLAVTNAFVARCAAAAGGAEYAAFFRMLFGA